MSGHSRNDAALLLESSLFDNAWYSDQFKDVALSGMEASHHYLHYGHLLGRNPSPSFDAQKYLAHNDDVAGNDVNPLLHFLKHGKREGRLAYPFLVRDEDRPYDPLSLINSLHLFEPGELPDELRFAIMHGCGNPQVSVVVPTWNRRDVISRALRSAFSQTLAPHEVIVTDDGSTDGTLEMLNAEFADEVARGKLILLSGSRGGVSHARNQGLERATGDFVAYLDSDNEWHPHHLLYAAGILTLHPVRHCAYTAIRVNRAEANEKKILGRRYDRGRLLRGNYIDLNAFVHRREVYTRLGGV